MSRPFVVGVAGGTASGKTTVTQIAARRLGASVLTHDRYYRDARDPVNHDFDHPESLETSLLVQHLDALRRGEAIDAPVYDFATHTRTHVTEHIPAAPLLFVEGILVLAEAELVRGFDLAVYVHCDDDVRLGRRIRRDTRDRGRTWDDVLHQWFATVRPAHKAYVEPSRERAALVLDGEGELEAEVSRLVDAVRSARAGG